MTPVLAVCASADVGRIAVAVSRTAARTEETALLNFPLLIRRPPLKGLSDGWPRGGAEDSRAPPSWFGRAGRSFGRAAAACLLNGRAGVNNYGARGRAVAAGPFACLIEERCRARLAAPRRGRRLKRLGLAEKLGR